MNSRYDKDTFIIHVEDTKGVIRIRKSKKDRQHNGQKEKRTNNDLQSIHIKLKIEFPRININIKLAFHYFKNIFKCFIKCFNCFYTLK
jgi:hypothetical protein